jgi:hypothetical protein
LHSIYKSFNTFQHYSNILVKLRTKSPINQSKYTTYSSWLYEVVRYRAQGLTLHPIHPLRHTGSVNSQLTYTLQDWSYKVSLTMHKFQTYTPRILCTYLTTILQYFLGHCPHQTQHLTEVCTQRQKANNTSLEQFLTTVETCFVLGAKIIQCIYFNTLLTIQTFLCNWIQKRKTVDPCVF